MTDNNSSNEKENKSFWDTTVGTITKITGLLTAITGLVLAVKPLLNSPKEIQSPVTIKGNDVATSTKPDTINYTPEKYIPSSAEISAFLEAAKTGNIDILKSKLDLGISVDIIVNDDPTTALVNAIDNNKPEAVKLLLEHKANPRTKIRGVSYPIIEASFWGFTEIVNLLIQYNVDLNIRKQDGSGITSLMFACINGHKDVVQKLIDAGAEVNLKAGNSTALDFANASGSPNKGQVIAILLSVSAHSGQ